VLEKKLRSAQDWLYSGIDPRYADKNLARLGLGLGQAAGFILGGELGAISGIARGLPAYLSARGVPAFLASNSQRMAGAAALGAGVNTADAARRIAEYEERTGEDVSAFKEMAALIPGAAMGLTEALPLYGVAGATGILGTAVRRRLMTEGITGVERNLLRGAIKGAVGEALQESGVELGQSLFAKALYDDDALNDLGRDVLDSAIIGGEVGGLLSVLTNLSMRSMGKRLHGLDYQAEESIRRLIRLRELEETKRRPMSGAITNLDPEAAEVTPEGEAKVKSILELDSEELQDRRNRHIELHREAIENRGDPFGQFYEGAPAETIEQEAVRRAEVDLQYEAQRAQQDQAAKAEIAPILGLTFSELGVFGSQPIEEIINRVNKIDPETKELTEDSIRPEVLLNIFTADRISKVGQDVRQDLRNFVSRNAPASNRYHRGTVAAAVISGWKQQMEGQPSDEAASNMFGGKDVPIEERRNNAVAELVKFLPADSRVRITLESKEYLDPEDINYLIEDLTVEFETGPFAKHTLAIDEINNLIYGFRGSVDLFERLETNLPKARARWLEDGDKLVLHMPSSAVANENTKIRSAVNHEAWNTIQHTKKAIFDILESKRIMLPSKGSELRGTNRFISTGQQAIEWKSSAVNALVKSVTGMDHIGQLSGSVYAGQRKALIGHIANMPVFEIMTVLPELTTPTYTAAQFQNLIQTLNDPTDPKNRVQARTQIFKTLEAGDLQAGVQLINNQQMSQLIRHAVDAGYITANPTLQSQIQLNEVTRPQTITETIDTPNVRFMTGEGSIYELLPDQTTVRQRVVNEDRKEGIELADRRKVEQPPSKKTFFVRPEDATRLSLLQVASPISYVLAEMPGIPGKVGIKVADGESAGQWVEGATHPNQLGYRDWLARNGLEPSDENVQAYWEEALVPYVNTPQVGLRALESWVDPSLPAEQLATEAAKHRTGEGYGNTVHSGTEITEVFGEDAVTIEAAETTNKKSLEELRERIAALEKDLKARLKRMGLKNVDLILTADADSMVASVESVLANPDNMRGAYAMLDGPVARIMVNLSAVDPNNELSSKEIIQKHLNEEIWHSYRRYGYMYQHEWDTLRSYALNNTVAKDVDEDANSRGINYVELAVERGSAEGLDINRQDAVEEGVMTVMQGLAQNRIPKSKSAGKVGTIKQKMINFAKHAIDAGRTADIADVFSIYRSFEQGTIGRRDAGLGRLSEEEAPVRSLYYTEYADPEMLEQLKAAIVEGNEAKQKQIAERIADEKVIMRRASNAPAPMSFVDRILNKALLDRDMENVNQGGVPLLGKYASDLALDEIFRQRTGAGLYEMPSAVKYRLRKQDNWVPDADYKELVSRYIPNDQTSNLLPGEIILQSAPDMGSTFEETKAAYEKVSEKFLGLFPKRWQGWRDWVADRSINLEMQERSIAGLNADQRANAETSAIAAVRFRDNAMNFFHSVLRDGNIVYVGDDLSSGYFKVIPDGEKTLGDVIGMLRGKDTRQAFKIYSIAQRLKQLNLTSRIEEAQALVAAHEAIAPELAEAAKQAGFTGQLAVGEYIAENGLPEGAEGYLNPSNLKFFMGRSKKLENMKLDGRDLDAAEIERIINTVQTSAPHVVEAWDNYQRLNESLIDWALTTGQITPEMAEVYKEDNYMPFYRDIGMVSAWPMGGNGRNRDVKTVELGRMNEADGSTIFDDALTDSSDLGDMDVVGNIVQNWKAAIRDGMTNVAAYRAIRDARELTDGGFGVQTRRVNKAGPDTMRILVDGQEQYWQMADPKLVQSVMMLGFGPTNQFTKLMRSSARLLRNMVINFPVFMYRNLLKDSQQAYITFGGTDVRPYIPIISSLEQISDSNMLENARMAGIATGGNIDIDVYSVLGEEDPSVVKKVIRQQNLKHRAENPQSMLDHAAALWQAYEDFRDKSEAASRMAVYDRVLEATGSEAEAALQGLEIMNYGRRGSNPYLNFIMSGIPFMGGMIQGTDVLLRAHTGAPDAPGAQLSNTTAAQRRMRTFQRGMLMMSVTLGYYLFMRDDDDYKKASEQVKMNNFLIPLPGGKMLRIPIAFTTGMLYKAMPESMLRVIFEQDYDLSDMGKEGVDQLKRNLDIHIMPQLMRPFYNAMLNHDEFRGEKIVPTWLEDLPPEMQKTDWTSDTAELISSIFGFLPEGLGGSTLSSPMKMENMLRQYFGSGGLYVMMVGDRLIRGVTGENIAGTRHDWMRIENMPLIGEVIDDPGLGTGYQQDFYNLKDAVDLYVQRVSTLEEEGDIEKLRRYKERNRGLARVRPQIRSLNRFMMRWRQRRDAIMNGNLPHARKTELLMNMIEQRNRRLEQMTRLTSRSRMV